MGRTLRVISVLFGLLAGAQVATTSAWGQDDDVESFDRTPRDCVMLNRIRRTEVIDDRTILFHLRGGDVLRNYLPKTCPNLEREERFGYRTGTRQLCYIDTITVLERGGVGGFTCELGRFYPMSPEDVVELREGPSGIEATEIDVPDEE